MLDQVRADMALATDLIGERVMLLPPTEYVGPLWAWKDALCRVRGCYLATVGADGLTAQEVRLIVQLIQTGYRDYRSDAVLATGQLAEVPAGWARVHPG